MERVSNAPSFTHTLHHSTTPMSSLTNSTRRVLTRAIGSMAVLSLAATVGCSNDGTTAPDSPFSQIRKEVVDPAIISPVLERKKAIRVNRTNHFRIDQKGGWFTIPEAGLYIFVPENAVSAPLTISAKALTGDLMAYEFGPHGTKFNVPLQMYQDLDLAHITAHTDLSKFEVGYFADDNTLDYRTDKVAVNEFIPTAIEFQGRAVRFEVSHFSGYVIATGRGSLGGDTSR
jgi:hypothetical protein